MEKNPAFQFYVKDWLSDPELRLASAATRGIWIDLLCFMKWDSKQNGTLRAEHDRFVRMLGITKPEFDVFISEAKELNFCDISVTVTESNSVVTIINRRLLREAIDKENTRLRVQKYRRNKAGNADVTPLKQPSPSPIPCTKVHYNDQSFQKFWGIYPKKQGKKEALKAWKKVKNISELLPKILSAVNEQKSSRQWQEGYIPNASTWLNGARWEDEVERPGQIVKIESDPRITCRVCKEVKSSLRDGVCRTCER